MKKIALIVILAVFGFCGLTAGGAATEKGATWIQGYGSFTNLSGDLYKSYNYDSQTYISINSSVNTFVAKGLFLGGTIGLNYNKAGSSSSTSIGIGPNIGYAFGGSKSTTIPYLFLNYMYESPAEKITGSDIIIGAGLNNVITEHIGIDVNLSYHIESLSYDKSSSSVSGNRIMIGFGVTGILY